MSDLTWKPLITDPLAVLMVLLALICLAEWLAKRGLGKAMGAAIIVILLGALAANIRLIPAASNAISLYGFIFDYIAPIAIFYLVLGVNLNKLKQAGTTMLWLFLAGSVATVGGVLFATWLVPTETALGQYAPAIAGMITGTYTGGSINFNAVATHYQVTESGILYAGTVAVDNVMTTLWILATLAMPAVMSRWLPSVSRPSRSFKKQSKKPSQNQSQQAPNQKLPNSAQQSSDISEQLKTTQQQSSLSVPQLALLVFSGVAALWLAKLISELFPNLPMMLVITSIGLVLAQLPWFAKQTTSHTLGVYLVHCFLVVIGAFCELEAVHQLGHIGLTLLAFIGTVVLVHGLLMVLLGRLISKDWDMIAIASQANVGGGTTAMALAESFNRRELIVPAILIGSFGNALGTYLGFSVAALLS